MPHALQFIKEQDTHDPVPAGPARCLRCSADLSCLPEWARYCPACGLDTLQSPPAALMSSAASSSGPIAGWKHLGEFVALPLPVLPDTAFGHDSLSLTLSGYSNAMYKLGRRYESGLGAARNPREAIRCYFKAARLGNLWALARLAAGLLDERNTPGPPDVS